MAAIVAFGDYGLFVYLSLTKQSSWLFLSLAIASEVFAIFAHHQYKESEKMKDSVQNSA
jgi:hypothetical protein